MELVRVSKVGDNPRVLFKPNTLYSWHSTGKNLELFTKLSGTLFYRLDRQEEVLARNSGVPANGGRKPQSQKKGGK